MRTIIAGSRTIMDMNLVLNAITESGLRISEVVSGCAPGVDRLGEEYARGAGLPLKRFPADWANHGKTAGPLRNRQMANYADALLLIWDGKSRGSASMKREALKRGLRLHEFVVEVPNDD